MKFLDQENIFWKINITVWWFTRRRTSVTRQVHLSISATLSRHSILTSMMLMLSLLATGFEGDHASPPSNTWWPRSRCHPLIHLPSSCRIQTLNKICILRKRRAEKIISKITRVHGLTEMVYRNSLKIILETFIGQISNQRCKSTEGQQTTFNLTRLATSLCYN